MLRILNVEPVNYSPSAKTVLELVAQVDDCPMDRRELMRRIGDYDALIVRFGHRIDSEIMAAGSRLKAIGCGATGTDHIDAKAAEARNIAIISLRGEADFLRGIPASAEFTWALLLALMRNVPQAVASVRSGAWTRDAFRGRDLKGKRLGIVGCGRIGEMVAGYALAFRMSVSAYDPFRSELPESVQRCDTLDALLASADVVSVHVPLNEGTRGMLDERAFSMMKKGAVLVNTARGAVLDEPALLAALESGSLAGAALDVLSDEPPTAPALNPLLRWSREHDSLIITPHIGGATNESMAATELFVAQRLARLLSPEAAGS